MDKEIIIEEMCEKGRKLIKAKKYEIDGINFFRMVDDNINLESIEEGKDSLYSYSDNYKEEPNLNIEDNTGISNVNENSNIEKDKKRINNNIKEINNEEESGQINIRNRGLPERSNNY